MQVITKPLEMFGGTLGIILALALAAGMLAYWHVGAAVEERGPDRARLIRWLEQGALRAQYVWLLERGLNRLDRALGDAGRADLSWPSPFGNRDPAPYWTGPAFHRLAALAVAYPLGSLLLCWSWFGDAGPVGEVLSLQSGAVGWHRALTGLGLLAMLFSILGAGGSSGVRLNLSAVVVIAVIFASAFASAVAGANAAALLGVMGVAAALVVPLACAADDADFVAVAAPLVVVLIVLPGLAYPVAFAVAGAFHVAVTIAGACALAAAGAFAVAFAGARAAERERLGRFWCAFAPMGLLLCYAALASGAWAAAAPKALAMITTFSLLPLVNLPFDFASLGLTRALLRRGCEAEAPSPLWLGLLDLLLAILLLILLAAALVLAAEAADAVVLRFGGERVLDAAGILRLIAEQPESGANGWVYVMLFSTLIPSVLNACIGAASLLSWSLPRLRLWLLAELQAVEARDEGWTGLKATRDRIVVAFAVQAAASVALSLFALWGLFEAFTHALPSVLPGCVRALQWFAATSGAWFGLPA